MKVANAIVDKASELNIKTYCIPSIEQKKGAKGHISRVIIYGFRRKIDIFRANNISKSVSNFHLGCVRAFYDVQKERLICFPSFISAAKAGINIDLKWVSCNKDARSVILKYYQRGFGTILNSSEMNSLRVYTEVHNDKWPIIKKPYVT